MKKCLMTMCIATTTMLLSAATLQIKPITDKIWKIGETVDFTSTALGDDKKPLTSGSYTLTVTNSGGDTIGEPYEVDIAKANPFSFSAKLDRPGFIMVISSNYRTADGKAAKWSNHKNLNPPHCGVPVEPEKIRPAEPAPADFDAFWQDVLATFKDATVTVTPEKEVVREGYNVSRITIAFPDKSGAIDGFLAIPEGDGKYPLVVSVPGAGPGTTVAKATYNPSTPAINLVLNVHKFPTAASNTEQRKRYNAYNTTFPDKKIYILSQPYDRDKYIFRNVWPAISCAIDYVAANVKAFDGKHIAVVGSSQGGSTALALSYLNKKVTCAVANIPGFCDQLGYKAGRRPGSLRINRHWKQKAADAIRYFDCANFALNIKNPVLMSAGFADLLCAPSTIYAAYNTLKCPKHMHHMLREGHATTRSFAKRARKFLDAEFAR